MLHELTKRDFRRIDYLMDKHTNIEARAVITGNNPGWIFVEDADAPESALVWSQGNKNFYLLGSEASERFNTALLPYIQSELTPRMKEMAYKTFEISGTHKKWNLPILSLFAEHHVKCSTQRVYTFTQKSPPQAKPIPKGFTIVPVDRKTLSTPLENSVHIVEELERYWHSVRVFLHDGFAYCAIDKGAIASICFVSYICDKTYALRVETFDPYAGQELSQAVAAECVKRALQDKVVPYWDCSDNDNASVKTAESLGFKKQWEYIAYSYKLDI